MPSSEALAASVSWSHLARRLRTTAPVRPFRKTLAHVAGLLAMPYGYTVSLWGASAVASAHFGLPGGWEIVAFAGGAIVAFLLVARIAEPDLAHQVPNPVSSAIVLNVLPVISVAVAPLCLLIPAKPPGFAVASFLVTLTYALSAAAFLEVVGRAGRNGQPSGR